MQKKWFTIIASAPKDATLHQHLARNCIGDFVPQDGMTNYLDVSLLASKYAEQFHRVCVFLGKDKGKLVQEYINGNLQ